MNFFFLDLSSGSMDFFFCLGGEIFFFSTKNKEVFNFSYKSIHFPSCSQTKRYKMVVLV